MSTRRTLGAWLSIACLGALVGTGCATHKHHTPRYVGARLDDSHTVTGEEPFSVGGARAQEGGNRIGVFNGPTITVEYAEYTSQLVDTLRKAFRDAGAVVSPEAERGISVRVVHVNFALGGLSGSDCYVDVVAATTDGFVRGLRGEARSSNVERACNHAIARAARAVVADPGIRHFVESAGSEHSAAPIGFSPFGD